MVRTSARLLPSELTLIKCRSAARVTSESFACFISPHFKSTHESRSRLCTLLLWKGICRLRKYQSIVNMRLRGINSRLLPTNWNSRQDSMIIFPPTCRKCIINGRLGVVKMLNSTRCLSSVTRDLPFVFLAANRCSQRPKISREL